LAERTWLGTVSVFLFCSGALLAEPFELRRAQDKVILLPFENESRDADLAYLENGLPESMAAVFSRTGFTLGDAEPSFSIDPEGPVRNSRGKLRVYLDVRVQKWNEELFRMRTRGDLSGIARLLGARYLVTGVFRAEPEEDITIPRAVHADVRLFDSATGKTLNRSIESNLKSILADAAPAAEELRAGIEIPARFKIQFEGQEEVMVYLDEQYLGRSPLSAELPEGIYSMRLEKDGRVSRLEKLRVTRPASVNVSLEEKKGRCSLAVSSTPQGAEVYLDLTPVGTTPLSRSDLPCGTHRVRVSLADHIDRFQGVVMREGAPAVVDLALAPGDTEKAFRDPRYAFLDFTHADLSFYSFMNALAFYGGYAYFQGRARTIENRARREVPLLSILDIQSMTLYHASILERNRLDAKTMQQRSKASAAAGGVMFAASVWFFYKTFDSDYRETGEVGAFFSQRPEISGQRTGHRWDAGYVLRF
jgi:hypothetical protein